MDFEFPHRSLTKKQEQELFRQLEAGQITEQEIVKKFLYLIPANMAKFMFEPEDVAQEGVIALYSAVRGFDPERGLRFSTYAAHWLRQAAFSYMYNNSSTVRIPVYMRKLMYRIAKGQHPKDASESSIRRARALLHRSTGPLTDYEVIEPPMVDELTPRIREHLNRLPERERRLVRKKFMQGRTLSSISREEGVSVERVRQVIVQALAKLRCPELEELL